MREGSRNSITNLAAGAQGDFYQRNKRERLYSSGYINSIQPDQKKAAMLLSSHLNILQNQSRK